MKSGVALAVLPCNDELCQHKLSEAVRTEREGLAEVSEGGVQSNLSCRLVCLRILACGF
jgi:hypothetical protein